MRRHPGFTVWFTGLAASGKSTIARLVAEELQHRLAAVELLSGGEFRQNLSQGLGYSAEDGIARHLERPGSGYRPPICTPFEAKWNPNRVTGVPPIA